MRRDYEFILLVREQGVDLGRLLRAVRRDNPEGADHELRAEAFSMLAKQYEIAARLCHRMSAVLADTPEIWLGVDANHIMVRGPREVLDALLEGEDALLQVPQEEEGR